VIVNSGGHITSIAKIFYVYAPYIIVLSAGIIFRTGRCRRRLKQAIRRAQIKRGYEIQTVQDLLGHKDVRTTMIYTHVLNRGTRGVQSPMDP